MKIYDGLIPFYTARNSKALNLSSYGTNMSDYRWGNGVEKENLPFVCRLVFGGYSRGRSSATFDAVLDKVSCIEDDSYGAFLEGCQVSIMMNDMNEIITKMTIENGVTNYGSFAFCKRGTNYGLMFINNVWE